MSFAPADSFASRLARFLTTIVLHVIWSVTKIVLAAVAAFTVVAVILYLLFS